MHTRVRTRVRTCVRETRARMDAHRLTRINPCTHTHMNTFTRKHARTHAHTHARTRVHTQTHIKNARTHTCRPVRFSNVGSKGLVRGISGAYSVVGCVFVVCVRAPTSSRAYFIAGCVVCARHSQEVVLMTARGLTSVSEASLCL